MASGFLSEKNIFLHLSSLLLGHRQLRKLAVTVVGYDRRVQVDTQYDEQKEQIQQQLVMEQQMISDVNRLYPVSRNVQLFAAVVRFTMLYVINAMQTPCIMSYILSLRLFVCSSVTQMNVALISEHNQAFFHASESHVPVLM